MTACASRIRAFENSAGVTSVATDVLVRTLQVKTGAEMIKRFLRLNL